jgi:hypothetical protein
MGIQGSGQNIRKRVPAQAATKKPAYWELVRWIIANDGSAGDVLEGLPNDPNQTVTREALSQLVTVGMLADAYGMEARNVAFDMIRASTDYTDVRA